MDDEQGTGGPCNNSLTGCVDRCQTYIHKRSKFESQFPPLCTLTEEDEISEEKQVEDDERYQFTDVEALEAPLVYHSHGSDEFPDVEGVEVSLDRCEQSPMDKVAVNGDGSGTAIGGQVSTALHQLGDGSTASTTAEELREDDEYWRNKQREITDFCGMIQSLPPIGVQRPQRDRLRVDVLISQQLRYTFLLSCIVFDRLHQTPCIEQSDAPEVMGQSQVVESSIDLWELDCD